MALRYPKRKHQDVDRFILIVPEQNQPPKKKSKIIKTGNESLKSKFTKKVAASKKNTQKVQKQTKSNKNTTKRKTAQKVKSIKPPKVKKLPKPKPEKEVKKKWNVVINPSIKVLSHDPFFEAPSIGSVPFVSADNYSKLTITAVNKGDKNMLQQILKSDKISWPLISRSVIDSENALNIAIAKNRRDLAQILIDDKNTPPKRAPLTQANFQTTNTGDYNWKSLGIGKIRKINIARGSREGVGALSLKSTYHQSINYNHLLTAIMERHTPLAAFDYLYSIADKRFHSSLYRGVAQNARYGNHEITLKLIKEAMAASDKGLIYGFLGMGRLHLKVLECARGQDLPKYRPTSVVKKDKQNHNITPVHLACINPNPSVLSNLLASYPECTMADKFGWRPVHYAAVCVTSGPLELLLKRGVNPYEVTLAGETPLHLACKTGRVQNVRTLLNFAKSANRKSEEMKRVKQMKAKLSLKKSAKPTPLTPLRRVQSLGVKAQKSTPGLRKIASVAAPTAKNIEEPEDEEDKEDEDDDEVDDPSVLSGEAKFGLGGINRPTSKSSQTPLHLATDQKHIDVIAELLTCSGLLIDKPLSPDNAKMTALMTSVRKGHMEAVKMLVVQGKASVDIQDKFGRTALIHASLAGYAQVASFLLHMGANPNQADTSGNSALHYAAAYGWFHCVDQLIAAGADYKAASDWGFTPFSVAFMSGNVGIVHRLMKEPGVDVNFKDESGVTLVMKACQSKLQTGLVTQLETLISKFSADCTAKDISDRTALHFLAQNSVMVSNKRNLEMTDISVTIAKLLISKGCDPTVNDIGVATPIDLACKNFNLGLVELFLSRGCTITEVPLKNLDGTFVVFFSTLLHNLAEQCRSDHTMPILECLVKNSRCRPILDKMAKVRDFRGLTPLLIALEKGANKLQDSFLRCLIYDLNSDINAFVDPPRLDSNPPINTPVVYQTENRRQYYNFDDCENPTSCPTNFVLLSAIVKSDPETVDLLIEAGRNKKKNTPLRVDPIIFDKPHSPLMEAVKLNKEIIVEKLIAAGAKVNAPNINSLTPLMRAVIQVNVNITRQLLDGGADPLMTDKPLGNTALHYAACQRTRSLALEDIVKALLAACRSRGGVKLVHELVNRSTLDQYRTALHLAANFNPGDGNASAEVEQLLVENGANIWAVDCRGRIPLHYAFTKIGNHTCTSSTDPIELIQVLLSSFSLHNPKTNHYRDLWHCLPIHLAARRGATICVGYLVSNAGSPLSSRALDRNTPLAMAVAGAHLNCAMSLVQLGSSITDTVYRAPDPEVIDNSIKWTPIVKLANKIVPESRTIFQCVLSHNWHGYAFFLVERLVKEGVPHHMLLEDCMVAGVLGLTLTLMRRWHKADNVSSSMFHARNSSGESLLSILAQHGPIKSDLITQHQLAEFIMRDPGPSRTSPDNKGCTPLNYCALRRHYGLAKFIIERKWCTTKEVDKFNRNVLSATFWNATPMNEPLKDWLEFLMKEGVNFNQHCDLPNLHPFVASMKRKVDYFQSGTAYKASAPEQESTSKPVQLSPLIAVIRDRNFDLARYLLTKGGADVNFSDSLGCTPLMHAIQVNDIKFVRLLTDFRYDGTQNYDFIRRQQKASTAPTAFDKTFTLQEPTEDNDDSDDEMDEDNDDEEEKEEEEEDNDDEEEKEEEEEDNDDEEEEEEEDDMEGAEEANDGDDSGSELNYYSTHRHVKRNKKFANMDSAIPYKYMHTQLSSPVVLLQRDKLNNWTFLHHLASPIPEASFDNAHILRMLLRTGLKVDKILMQQFLELALKNKAVCLAKTIQFINNVPTKQWKLPTVPALPVSVNSNAIPFPAWCNVEKDAEHQLAIFEAEVKKKEGPRVIEYVASPDSRSGIQNVAKVVLDDRMSNRAMDVLLNKVEVRSHNIWGCFNFYLIQVLHNTVSGVYFLFTCWGRIGDRGQNQCTPFSSLEETKKEFDKVFRAKTGNKWIDIDKFDNKPKKYRLVTTDRRHSMAYRETYPLDISTKATSKLSSTLYKLIYDFINPEKLKHDMSWPLSTQLLPFGRLRPADLKKAMSLLDEIAIIAEEVRNGMSTDTKNIPASVTIECEKLIKLSNDYFWLVPQSSFTETSLSPLLTEQSISNQGALLKQLNHLNFRAQHVMGASRWKDKLNPVDYVYSAINCSLEDISASPPRFIPQLVMAVKQSKIKIQQIFSIYRHKPSRCPEPGSYRRLLWHGTASANLLSILHHGLLTTAPGVRRNGQVYGPGVYLSDAITKSLGYTTPSEPEGHRMLLLCEVDLTGIVDGNHEDDVNNSNDVRLVRGNRKPDPLWDIVLPDGCKVGLGHLEQRGAFDEFIISDESRIKLRYLVVVTDN